MDAATANLPYRRSTMDAEAPTWQHTTGVVYWLVSCGLLLITGCGSPATPPPFAEMDTTDSADHVQLIAADAAVFTDALAEAEAAGHVVLVDFWATWCGPCLKQLPHTVELHRHYADAGLQVMTVSFDEVEDREAVLDVLRLSHAEFPNFLSIFGASPRSAESFGVDDGAIPHYQLYDKWGNLRHSLSESRRLQSLIEQLLAEPSPPAEAAPAAATTSAIGSGLLTADEPSQDADDE